MKAHAAVLVEPRRLELREFPIPDKLPAGHSLLRVEANGLCGGDFEQYIGKHEKCVLPTIPGHEIVGTIEQLSPEMAQESGLSEGDRIVLQQTIACESCKECNRGRRLHCKLAVTYSWIPLSVEPGLWGGYATHMLLRPRTRMYKIPSSLSAEDASLFNPMSNGIHWTIEVARVKLGDRVLIMGAGQRGLMCAVAAREVGAAQIILTGLARDEKKFALAQKFGATDFINVETDNVVEKVNDLTGGEGVDCALDLVPSSNQSTLDAIQALRPQGTLALAGVKGRPIEGLVTDSIFWKQLTIRGAFQASIWAAHNAARVLSEGRYPFSEMHSHQFPLGNADYALRVLGNEVDGVSPLHITLVP
jgi:threonine dehydrogenase-like Zn-dependent dehydrogenase